MYAGLNALPKDILILLLKYIENDTINKCKNDVKFLKESVEDLKGRNKIGILKFFASEYYIYSHCDCYSDEYCDHCDN